MLLHVISPVLHALTCHVMPNDVYPFLPFDLIIISYMLNSVVGFVSEYSSTTRAKDEPLDNLRCFINGYEGI
jgi:hypothetical protein